MWKLKQSGQFKKDLRKYQNDREKMKSLETVLVQLSEKGKVDKRYKPHRLKGEYSGALECHIENDYLLVWVDEEEKTIKLVRLGSHSELFK